MLSFLLHFIYFQLAIAGLNTNGVLNESQLYAVTESTGLALVTSYAENLYPLGGYPGLRASMSYRHVSNAKLRGFSQETQNISDLNMLELGLSKGLYSNVDFFLSMTPFFNNTSASSFSGGIRWSFFELEEKPINFLMAISGRSTNWSNQASFLNQTFDLISQYSGKNLFGYFGVGSAFVRSQFIGGAKGVTISGSNLVFEKSRGRPLLGGGWQSEHFSIALELTYFVEATATLKLSSSHFDYF
jgi:hypothetical protein